MGKHNKDKEYELFHPDYGIILGTREDFIELEPKLRRSLHHLTTGKLKRAYGWILADNLGLVKTPYTPRNRNIARKFYCPEEGVIELTISKFYEKYIKEEGGTYVNVSSLCSGVIKTLYNRWVLAENKDKYDNWIRKDKELTLGNKSRYAKPIKIVELSHPDYGTHKLSRKEFIDRFGLDKQCLTDLVTGRAKSRKGWNLVG